MKIQLLFSGDFLTYYAKITLVKDKHFFQKKVHLLKI